MKIFKYAVWIMILFLIQTVVVNDIRIYSLRPDVVLPFIAIIAVREDSFKVSTAVSVICAVMAGALCGRNFTFMVLFYTYLSAMIFNLRKHPRHMPDFIRYILWIFPAAIVSEVISYLLLYMSFDWFLKGFILYIIPSSIYTFFVSVVLYPIINATIYGRGSGKRQLIVK